MQSITPDWSKRGLVLMTECDYDGCDTDPVGEIIWETESEVRKAYCSEHLEQAREELPDWIQGVEIV